MKYSAFISYKSEDRAWARKLQKSLAARGIIDLFFDKDRLEVGFEWPQQLSEGLKESRHAIFFISKHAYAPESYVTFEHGQFLSLYYGPARENPLLPPRRIIYVLLEGNPPAGVDVHGVAAIKDDPRGLYAKGADDLQDDDPVWQSVVKQVARTITADDTARPVGCFLFAAPRPELETLNFDTRWPVDSLTNAIAKAGLSREQFLDRYGPSPGSWKLFGTDTIEDMLNVLKDRVNTRLGASREVEIQQLRIRLDTPDDVIWGADLDARDQEIDRWSNQPLIIVIDPLSLYVPRVAATLSAVTKSMLAGGKATFMVLGPRKAPDVNVLLRQILQSVAIDLHRVFEPALPLFQPQPLAGVNIDDEKEMQRLMTRTVAMLFRGDSPVGQAQQAEVIRMARLP